MLAHHFPLLGGERAGLAEDAGMNPDLADVVQLGGTFEQGALIFRITEFGGNQAGVDADPRGMQR
jgi:hypothetical protein